MRTALQNLQTSLDRVRELAQDIAANTTSALADPAVRRRHETQQCGAVVLLTGYFEAFLKDMVKSYVTSLPTLGLAFNALPERMRKLHFEAGGKVLSDVAKNSRSGRSSPYGSVTPEDVIARMHSCTGPASNYTILWEAFADTKQNPRPDVVKDILQNLGVKEVWPAITAKILSSGVQRSESSLISVLEDLIVVRNECAHTGTVNPIPGPEKLLNYADLLDLIAQGAVGVLEDAPRNY